MTGFEIILGIFVALGVGATLLLQLRRPAPPLDQRNWSAELTKLEKELENALREKNELTGKGKELYDRFKNLESDFKATSKERDSFQSTLTKLETKREQQEKEHHSMVEKLESAQLALREERQRVIHEEEKMRNEAEEERDRQWAEHEMAVISSLNELCKLPHLQFRAFTNSDLPEDFDGSLKPDFLIEFLDQYVIFDAKANKSRNRIQEYIEEQVKKTTEKVKKNGKIYPHIFLVVPVEVIREVKKLLYVKDQYYFYVVSREALAPILASLKRISTYELAETLDPQKRENIINMLSELVTHISYRNAHELLLTKMGANTLERIQSMDPEIVLDIEQKTAEKKLSQLSASEIKRLASSLTEQNMEIHHLASPKAAVKKSMIDAAQSVISQKLL